jgi:hypothetical protein
MTLHIGSQIACGELSNERKNSVCGVLDFGGEWGVHMQLTGRFIGELAGKHIRFQSSRPTSCEDCPREALDDLANMQIGVTGEMSLCTRDDGGVVLTLEWFSQNGHMRAELIDPIIAYGPEEKPPDEESDGAEGNEPESEPENDPFQLFAPELEEQWAESSRDEEGPPEPMTEEGTPRAWDEVIPGLDPETKRMYEEWDAITEGTKDVPFHELFDPPLILKRPADIASEEEAATALQTLLARLALHCVTVHICDHYSALDTYRLLLEELLPENGVHPNLKPTGFVVHYDTSESCDECDAEFDARWSAERDS